MKSKSFLQWNMILWLMGMLFAGCSNPPQPTMAIVLETPTRTPLPLTATITTTSTNTPRPSVTPMPDWIIPTRDIPASTDPAVLNVKNTQNGLSLLHEIGDGTLTDVAWSADGRMLVAAVGRKLILLDGQTFERQQEYDTGAGITRIALQPGGHQVAVAHKTQVEVWNLQTGKKVAKMSTPMTCCIRKLAFGSGGQVAALAPLSPEFKFDTELKVWQSATGKELFSPVDIVYAKILDFSPDGRQMLVYSSTGIQILDSTNGAVQAELDVETFTAIFSPDGTQVYFILFNNHQVQIWNPAEKSVVPMPEMGEMDYDNNLIRNGRAVAYFGSQTGLLLPEKSMVSDLNICYAALSPDGKLLALVPSGWQAINIIDAVSGETRKVIPFSNLENGMIGEMDIAGQPVQVLVSSGYQRVYLWNLENGELIRELELPDSGDLFPAIHPDGQQIAILDTNYALWIWAVNTETALRKIPLEQITEGPIRYSPDGSRIAFLSRGQDFVYEVSLDTGQMKNNGETSPLYAYAYYLFFPPFFYDPNGMLVIWDGKTDENGELILNDLTLKRTKKIPLGLDNTYIEDNAYFAVEVVSFSPDGRWLAVGNRLVDLSQKIGTGTLEGHEYRGADGWSGLLRSIYFHPSSQLIVSNGYDDTFRLWNIDTKQEIWQNQASKCAGFSPDGRFLVTAMSGVIQVWGLAEK